MSIRYNDRERVIALSARDLVESGTPAGHLVLDVVQTQVARMAAGRRIHLAEQQMRSEEDDSYAAEVRLKTQIGVGDWTVSITGRVDALIKSKERTIVEEIKSTALDAAALTDTTADTWPAWIAQLEVYLWILGREQWPVPTGRLVVISLADGSRHIIGVPFVMEKFEAFVHHKCAMLVERRMARLAWYASRRLRGVPWPFDGYRKGQRDIIDTTRDALDQGHRLLVQAPTGMGKTAALLSAALRHALSRDRQVFWATSRNTQQENVQTTLDRFREHGLKLRSITIRSRERGCLNDVVSCRPDACRFANRYHDKVHEGGLVERLADMGQVTPLRLDRVCKEHEVCPVQLALEVSENVDVVIGDYNYVFSPMAQLRRHFGTRPGEWIVIGDEVHQLVDRARGYFSPVVYAEDARTAEDWLRQDNGYLPYAELASKIAETVHHIVNATQASGVPLHHGGAQAELDAGPWRSLSKQIDDVALDYALLKARHPLDRGEDDPWLKVARQVIALAAGMDNAIGPDAAGSEEGRHTESIVQVEDGRRSVGLLCLDAAPHLRPLMGKLGGFVGASATVSPTGFYQNLLGLPHDIVHIETPSPFPPENRLVLVAPRISTAWRDRRSHANATAELTSSCARATSGNTAVYFPSFAMLRDITSRWHLPDHEVLVQRPSMKTSTRTRWLRRMTEPGPPVVLAAVLGGIFAEGIDLPEGGLSSVVVVGPALPPIGLERDLLNDYYERRFSQGFRYASLIPGVTRVVQAAGRLVRREDDRGAIVLVGRRFRWRDISSLLPADWDVRVTDDPQIDLRDFWGTH